MIQLLMFAIPSLVFTVPTYLSIREARKTNKDHRKFVARHINHNK